MTTYGVKTATMLWDRDPILPYHAVAPWPHIYYRNQRDWISSMTSVESWLEQCVGHHCKDWTWTMWTLHQSDLCGVSFRYEPHRSMFLLRFGLGD